jgi:hypothetical protein
MNRTLKRVLIVFVLLAAALFVGFQYMQSSTKKHSPEQRESLMVQGNKIDIFYSSPFVKNRKIFGGLVPYGEVWRTGANEATTVTFGKAVVVGGKNLEPGTYSVWTIPNPDEWEVFLNSGDYGWGVSWGAKASRDPSLDVVSLKVPVQILPEQVEQFNMSIQETPLALLIEWEHTAVEVPIAMSVAE